MASALDLDKPPPLPGSSLPPPPPRLQRALQAFEEAVGGRDSLVTELSSARVSDKEELALRLLADPGNDETPLHQILAYSGLSVRDFLKLFSDARGQRAYLSALDKVWQKLPDVAEDVMKKALPSTVFCTPCNGTGKQRLSGSRNKNQKRGPLKNQWERVHCDICAGTGRRPVEPTLDYQKLALTLGGLPKPIPGTHIDASKTTINANQNNYGADTMRDFIGAVARVKSVSTQVLEAEVIPPSEEV